MITQTSIHLTPGDDNAPRTEVVAGEYPAIFLPGVTIFINRLDDPAAWCVEFAAVLERFADEIAPVEVGAVEL